MDEHLKTIPFWNTLQREDADLLKTYMEEESRNAQETILKPGMTCRYLYFIVKGLVYSYADEESERILWYEQEGQSFTDVVSFYTQTPAQSFIKIAEEGTLLLKISYENLQEVYKTSARLAVWGVQFLQNEIVRLTDYYESLRVKDASQKYNDLIEKFPEALQRIPLGHIASYLGISQVSLSRIRGGVQKKTKPGSAF